MNSVPCVPVATMELNNNTPKEPLNLLDNSRQKRNSVSSGSSSNSDTSEDVDLFGNESKTVDSNGGKKEDQSIMISDNKITRSMSDGHANKLIPEEFADVFPSLPDSVLNKLGLLGGEVHRERVNEEELEQKFVALALAFTIDAATIKDRCQRQRRYRDQTENNLTAEIDRLIEKVTCIQPLCVDARTAELLTGLLAQIDVVIRASYHAAISAERFGAVQHEERLADAVNLMIKHVTLLKQQRDSFRKQLQYTKKVLQDTNSCERNNSKRCDGSINNRFVTRRRASIATIAQPPEINNTLPVTTINGDVRRISRRSSDISTRVSAFARTTRPSRLELGVDLGKIKEDVIDNGVARRNHLTDDSDSETALKVAQSTELTISHKMRTNCEQLVENVQNAYEASIQDGSLHDFFIFAALLCFVLSVIVLGNVLVELELSRRGINPYSFFNKLFSCFLNIVTYFQDARN